MSKIFVLSHHEVLPMLKSFVDIKNIPKSYGGELDWSWGDKPALDPAIRDAVTWEGALTDFPDGPKYWRPIEGDKLECIAVGSIKQVDRTERVCTIPRSYKGQQAVLPDAFPEVALRQADGGQQPEAAVAASSSSAAETLEVTAAEKLAVDTKDSGGHEADKDAVAAVTEKLVSGDEPVPAPTSVA